MGNNENNNSHNEAHPALASLRSLNVEPSPYLAVRVQANLKSAKQSTSFMERFSFRWIAVSFMFAVLVAAVIPFSLRNSETVNRYVLGQPYMIRMDIRAIPQNEIAYAEIMIEGESAEFSSKRFTEVNQRKVITLSAEQLKDKQYLPIVVKGIKKGEAKITVSFFNAKNDLVTSKNLTLDFVNGAI